MVTIKSFTSLQQSKKLAEILPIESADMCYVCGNIILVSPTKYGDTSIEELYKKHIIPCWSLAALLSALPDYTLQTNTDGTVFVVCESKKPMISDAYDNPIDACYELILKLHELKML